MSKFRAGAVQSPAEAWKERAEELAQQILEVAADKDELQGRLDEIASIADPDKQEDSLRLEKIEAMLQMLMTQAGLELPATPEEDDRDKDPEEDTLQ